MDLVVLLLTTVACYDAVFIVLHRFSKLLKFTPCMIGISAAKLAQLFMD